MSDDVMVVVDTCTFYYAGQSIHAVYGSWEDEAPDPKWRFNYSKYPDGHVPDAAWRVANDVFKMWGGDMGGGCRYGYGGLTFQEFVDKMLNNSAAGGSEQ